MVALATDNKQEQKNRPNSKQDNVEPVQKVEIERKQNVAYQNPFT